MGVCGKFGNMCGKVWEGVCKGLGRLGKMCGRFGKMCEKMFGKAWENVWQCVARFGKMYGKVWEDVCMSTWEVLGMYGEVMGRSVWEGFGRCVGVHG